MVLAEELTPRPLALDWYRGLPTLHAHYVRLARQAASQSAAEAGAGAGAAPAEFAKVRLGLPRHCAASLRHASAPRHLRHANCATPLRHPFRSPPRLQHNPTERAAEAPTTSSPKPISYLGQQ